MSFLLSIAIVTAVLSSGGILWLLLAGRSPRMTITRVLEVTRAAEPSSSGSRRALLTAKIFSATHWVRTILGMPSDETLQERLAGAGFRKASSADAYVAARLLGPAIGVAIGFFMPFYRMSLIVALPGIAFLLPDLILKRLTLRRRERIRKSIPDTVDLMVICVDAGLGLDQAMLRVAQELGVSHPDLSDELLQMNHEQRAGKLRLDVWQGMATRCKLPDIDALVNMLMQTERFGTPIARALSQFADGIRLRRRQRAEEMAAKTTIKIIFPLVIFIFPTLFIVLLGPAAISIMRGFSATIK